MCNHSYVMIPEIDNIVKVAEENQLQANTEIMPSDGFEIYNKDSGSDLISLMNEELSLFSIDLSNPRDKTLVKALQNVLGLYNLPVKYLNDDITRCYEKNDNFERYYECFCVEYMPPESYDDTIYIRYRKLLDANGEYKAKNFR